MDPGQYAVTITFLGYEKVTIPVLIGEKNDNYNLGKILLKVKPGQLEEVVISSDRETVAAELDRKYFSLEDNFVQSSGSVLDVMKALPGITVDQEGKVLLRGSDKVAILIDGKQSSLTGFGNQKGLDNIPASNVTAIEIINNPSAKYDAAGMAGIVNIIYKKEKDTGFNGDVGLTLGLGQLSRRKEDLPTDLGSYAINPKVIPSLNMNYRMDKFNFFLQSEMLLQERLPNNEFTTRWYEDGQTVFSQVAENRKQVQYILKGGVDYNIDELNTLSISSIFDYENHTDTSQVPFINSVDMERYRFWSWSESEVTGFFNVRLDYNHKFREPGHEFSISLQYTKGWEDEAYYLNDSSSIRNSKDTTHLIATEYTIPFLVDYIKPLRSGRLEAGSKIQIRRIPVTYDIGPGDKSIIYPGLGDWSEWGENIYAGYVNYIHEKLKYDIEAGLRVEQTDVFYNLSEENVYYNQNDAYTYFRIYPNIRLTLKINDRNNISAFFNNRVDRPGEPELRIFPKYDDPELLKVGNPYLRPQFTQTYELAYKYYWPTGSVYVSAYHREIKDPFTRIYAIDTTNQDYNIINKIYQNVGSGTNTGFEFIVSQSISDFWKLDGSFNWYQNVIEAHEGRLLFPYERSFFIEKSVENTWNAKINNQVQLPKDTQLQLTFAYYASANIAQGHQHARSSLDLGLRKKIFNQRGEFIFSFTDVFNQSGIKQEVEGDGFKALYENYFETQIISMGIKYDF